MKKYLNIECYMRHDEDEDSLWVGSLSPDDLGDLYSTPTVKEFNQAVLTIIRYMAETGCYNTKVCVNTFIKNILKDKSLK